MALLKEENFDQVICRSELFRGFGGDLNAKHLLSGLGRKDLERR